MAIEAEALRALSDGEVEALSRKLALLLLEERPMTTGRLDTLARIRPIIREMYPAFAAIHRSALAEDTARAAEGWQPIETAPKDGTAFLGFLPQFGGYVADQRIQRCHWTGWGGGCWECELEKGGRGPTHWRPLPAPPALPLTKGAADANR